MCIFVHIAAGLLPGVYVRGSKRSHTGGKSVTYKYFICKIHVKTNWSIS